MHDDDDDDDDDSALAAQDETDILVRREVVCKVKFFKVTSKRYEKLRFAGGGSTTPERLELENVVVVEKRQSDGFPLGRREDVSESERRRNSSGGLNNDAIVIIVERCAWSD